MNSIFSIKNKDKKLTIYLAKKVSSSAISIHIYSILVIIHLEQRVEIISLRV